MLNLHIVRFVLGTFSIAVVVLASNGVSGQYYPNRPIRMVTSPVGGGTDFAARIVAQGLAAGLGQQVVVDNRPGIFHGLYLPKAPPDGYSLLMGGEGIWQRPLLEKAPYDPVRDFAPIALVGISPNVLVVHPSVPVKSVKELIDLAKTKPAELNYGSTAPSGSADLATQLFMAMTGVKFMQIPHKGTGDVVIAVASGQGVLLGFLSIAAVAPQIKAGRLRALAVTSVKRSAVLPELPTVAETAPGYQSGGETALFAPPRTPAAIIIRLNRETVRFLNTAETKERFVSAGIDVAASSPEELGAFIKSDIARWARVIKDAGIKIN